MIVHTNIEKYTIFYPIMHGPQICTINKRHVLIFNLFFVLCNTYRVTFFSKNFPLGSNQVHESGIFGLDQGLGQLGPENLTTNVLEFTYFSKFILTERSDNRPPKIKLIYDRTVTNLRT